MYQSSQIELIRQVWSSVIHFHTYSKQIIVWAELYSNSECTNLIQELGDEKCLSLSRLIETLTSYSIRQRDLECARDWAFSTIGAWIMQQSVNYSSLLASYYVQREKEREHTAKQYSLSDWLNAASTHLVHVLLRKAKVSISMTLCLGSLK